MHGGTRMATKPLRITALAGALLMAAACNGTIGDTGARPTEDQSPDDDDYVPQVPFEAVPAVSYVAKVKMLMTGLAATDEEVATIQADPSAMSALVDQWFATPEAATKFHTLYVSMFQQNNFTEVDAGRLIGGGSTPRILGRGGNNSPLFVNLKDSFARTVDDIVANNERFNSTATTRRVWMTTAMMAYYLMNDQYVTKDDNKKVSRPPQRSKTDPDGFKVGGAERLQYFLTYTPYVDAAQWNKAFEDALNPSNAKYMHFPIASRLSCTVADMDPAKPGYVKRDANGKAMRKPFVFDDVPVGVDGYGSNSELKMAQRLFHGAVTSANVGLTLDANKPTSLTLMPRAPAVPADDRAAHPSTATADYASTCQTGWEDKDIAKDANGKVISGDPRNVAKVYINGADYEDWRPVTIIQSDQSDSAFFFDLPTLRNRDTITLRTPRVGFFSTPAFQATYPSNNSNQARGIVNQALIVALGKSINPSDKAGTIVLDFGDDAEHSDPTSACFTCHRMLDPMREVMAKTYSYAFAQQTDPAKLALEPVFDFLGITTPTPTLEDFGNALASHPLYASGTTQYLCYYANSAPCTDQDPEFQRVAKAFEDSNFNFRTLVRELMSSPLVTGASRTRTLEDRGDVVSIARYNHLCTSLQTRLKLDSNPCAANSLLAAVIPADGFARAAEAPTLSTDPTMFFRSAAERLCMSLAVQVVDSAKPVFTSADKTGALDRMMTDVMGVSQADPAYTDAYAILTEHYDAALAAKGNTGNAAQKATQALRSTFTLACTAPTALTIGL